MSLYRHSLIVVVVGFIYLFIYLLYVKPMYIELKTLTNNYF